MPLDQIVVAGTVQADGTLALDEKLSMPVGRVRVTVEALQDSVKPNVSRLLAMMEQIWADQMTRGHVRRTKEEIDAEIAAMQAEADEEMQAVERVHDECQSAGQHSEPRQQ